MTVTWELTHGLRISHQGHVPTHLGRQSPPPLSPSASLSSDGKGGGKQAA